MMLEKKTTEFLEELSSKAPVPGGGGASAAVGAFACALGMMVTNLTIGKKTYAPVEEEILSARDQLLECRERLVSLVDEDAEGFAPLARAYRMPKETPEQRQEKERVMEAALREACTAPLAIMETILEVMDSLELLEEKGSRLALSDVGVGILFAQAALEGASLNVWINTKMMKDQEYAGELNRRAERMIEEGESRKTRISRCVSQTLRG